MDVIEKKRISDAVIEHIQNKLKAGCLKPGDKLPSEKVMSEKLGISKASLREALQKLGMIGILDTQQGKGTFVARDYPSAFLRNSILPAILLTETNSLKLLEAREFIEKGTASLSAQNAKPEDLNKLKANLEKMEEAVKIPDIDSFSEKDLEFHLIISKSSRNEVLHLMVKVIRDLMFEQQQEINRVPDVRESSFNFHKRIYEAIRAHDRGQAAKTMSQHIKSVQRKYLKVKSNPEV